MTQASTGERPHAMQLVLDADRRIESSIGAAALDYADADLTGRPVSEIVFEPWARRARGTGIAMHAGGWPLWVGLRADERSDGATGQVVRVQRACPGRAKCGRCALDDPYVEHAMHAVCVLDPEMRILRVNPRYVESSGHTHESLLGSDHFELFPNPDNEELFRKVLDSGEPYYEMGRPFAYADHPEWGTTYWDLSLVPTQCGQAQCLVMGLNEVTDKVRAHRRVQELEERLRVTERLEAVGRFTVGVAHDLNNALFVMRGSAHLLGMPDLERDEQEEIVTELRQAIAGASSLTSRLLKFSSGEYLQLQPVHLSDVVAGIIGLIDRLVGSAIAMRVELGPVPAAFLDPEMFEQILLNLAANARDAMPEGGTLRISCREGEVTPGSGGTPGRRCVSVVVEDTGTGMTQEELGRIFEPFYTTKSRQGGVGLGLSGVRSLVRQFGGRVHVESTLGVGTRFELVFPEVDSTSRPGDVAGARGRVMVVDPSPSSRRLAEHMLETAGWQVETAATASEAMQHAEASTVDVLLTELTLPDLGGRLFALEFQRRHPRVRVVYMSPYHPDIPEDPAASDVPLIHKPFSLEEVAQFVEAALDADR